MSSSGSSEGSKDWKPYTVPYTGGGAVHTSSGWVPSAWMVGPGVAQSPSGQVLSSSDGKAMPSSSSSPPSVSISNQNQNLNLNLPAGAFTRPPDRPKSPATVEREAEQVRRSCGGQRRVVGQSITNRPDK